jgi:hypothetical protein
MILLPSDFRPPSSRMVFTPDRLLILAVVVTLISIDGIYRAWLQRADERIGKGLFVFYTVALVVGSGLTWLGFFLKR